MKTRKMTALLLLAALVLTLAMHSCGGPAADPEDTGKEPGGAPAGKTFYVSPDGDDAGDGSEESPLATAEGARKAVLGYRKGNGLPDGGIEVLFLPGTYMTDSTVTFGPEDSGEEGKEIVYRAKEPGSVYFSGGITIDASLFVPASEEVKARISDPSARDSILEADLAAAGCYDTDDSGYYISAWQEFYRQELYVDGERQTPARWPNTGYYYSTTYLAEDPDGYPYSAIPEEKAAAWAGKSVRYYGYPVAEWDCQRFEDGDIRVNAENSTLEFLCEVSRLEDAGIGSSGFYLYNLLEEIDSPCEYYWDVENSKLYYFPDGDLTGKRICFSQFAGRWFVFDGCSHISFSGITFENGRSDVFSNDTAADEMNITHHITLDGCVFRAMGANVIWLDGMNITVSDCEFYNIGGACVYLNGGDANEVLHSNNVITNNLFHDFGQVRTTKSPAVMLDQRGTTVGHSNEGFGCIVSHNEIYNAPHTAIFFQTGNCLIEYNYIHDVCKETSDAGAIYSYRHFNWSGNVIRFNRLENIYSTGLKNGHPRIIYLDDMLAGQTVYGNIVAGGDSQGILVGGGKYNRVEYNIIVNVKGHPIDYDDRAILTNFGHEDNAYPKGSMWLDMTNRVNYLSDMQRFANPQNLIFIEQTGYSQTYTPDDPGVPSYATVRGNVVYDCAEEKAYDCIGDSNEQYGNFEFNIYYYDDPGFVDSEGGNYSLRDDSRVYRDIPGFARIDYESIGRIG